MDEAVKTIIAGGGFINDATLFGLSKQAGGMGRMTDPGHLFDETITSLIDQGGQRTGTALSALGRQFLGDKMTKQTASELEDLGILPHGSWRTGGGAGIIMNPGYDIKRIDDIKSGNLPDFMLNVLGPAIRAKVGDDNPALMQESYKLFGQQTGQRLGLMFMQNEAQRERDVNLRHGVDPASVYQGIGDKDYAANVSNLGTSFQGLMQVLGSNAIPGAITTLHGLTAAIQGLTGQAADHPAAANNVLGSMLTPSLFTNAIQAGKDLWDHLPSFSKPPGSAAMPEVAASRDPHSPQSGTLAYSSSSIHAPIAAPPPVTLQPGGTVTGVAPINVTVQANVTAAIQTVMAQVKAEISGTLTGLMSGFKSGAGNSSAGFDGRSAPSTPDASTMHGGY